MALLFLLLPTPRDPPMIVLLWEYFTAQGVRCPDGMQWKADRVYGRVCTFPPGEPE